MDNKKSLGTIFDTITFNSSSQLDNLIDNMDDAQIKFLTTKALESAFNGGAYTLIECEIISKIIRKTSYDVIIDSIKEKIKDYRKSGLEKEGELSYENLVFKFLRRSGHIEKLFDSSNKALDKELSIERKLEETHQ